MYLVTPDRKILRSERELKLYVAKSGSVIDSNIVNFSVPKKTAKVDKKLQRRQPDGSDPNHGWTFGSRVGQPLEEAPKTSKGSLNIEPSVAEDSLGNASDLKVKSSRRETSIPLRYRLEGGFLSASLTDAVVIGAEVDKAEENSSPKTKKHGETPKKKRATDSYYKFDLHDVDRSANLLSMTSKSPPMPTLKAVNPIKLKKSIDGGFMVAVKSDAPKMVVASKSEAPREALYLAEENRGDAKNLDGFSAKLRKLTSLGVGTFSVDEATVVGQWCRI